MSRLACWQTLQESGPPDVYSVSFSESRACRAQLQSIMNYANDQQNITKGNEAWEHTSQIMQSIVSQPETHQTYTFSTLPKQTRLIQ